MPKLVSLGDVAQVLYHVLPLTWMYRIARLHGRLVCSIKGGSRRIVSGNLAAFAGDESELEGMTRKFFEYRQTRSLMLLLFLMMKPEEREAHFAIEGLEHLDLALAQGKGVVLLGSHLNSLGVFLTIMILRQRGYDIRVALPSKDEPYGPSVFGRLMLRLSGRKTVAQHVAGVFVQFNVRPIVKALAENAIIGQTGDGWHSAAFTYVPFLGRSLPFTTGMMSVAQSTGAMVVPFNVLGEPPNLRSVIYEPFQVQKGEDPGGNLAEAVAGYVKVLERDLLANVLCWEHWLMEDTLDTMATWPKRPLSERYEL